MKIIVNGTGLMGEILKQIIKQNNEHEWLGGVNGKQQPHALQELIRERRPDCVIDFSHPDQLQQVLDACVAYRVPLLIGTTGLSTNQFAAIAQGAQEIPVLQTYNTSVGLYKVVRAVEMLAAGFSSYDAEVVEVHHNQKIDAPSGTAIWLKHAIEKARGTTGAADIGMHSLRLGKVVGEHQVYFGNENEVIEIKHKALNKQLFASGAVELAAMLQDKPAGLYKMADFFE